MQSSSSTMADKCSPRSLRELFLCFTWLAVQSVGGAAPIAQRELVERKRWLTPQEFLDDWTVAQIMPGPNVVNLALILGDRHFGLTGAVVALAGMTAVPLLFILSIAVAYTHYASYPVVENALRGMGAVAAGLIIGTGLKLLSMLKRNPIGLPAAAIFVCLTFVLIALLQWPLVTVLLGVGVTATLWAWVRLIIAEKHKAS